MQERYFAPYPADVLVQDVVLRAVRNVLVPGHGFSGRTHPAEEYSDCTSYHLPALNWKPDLPRNADAMFAIFAARMAFSSLEIRSPLKYGISAFNSDR